MIRLLIIDDEIHIADWLSDMFNGIENADLEVYKSYSATQALEIMNNLKIDIVLSDIKMPGISGLELADKVIANWPKCKIIFLTGYNDFSYIYSANQKGATRYILKTEDDSVIIDAVFSAISEIEQLKVLDTANQTKSLVNFLIGRKMINDCLNGNLSNSAENNEKAFFLMHSIVSKKDTLNLDLFHKIPTLCATIDACLGESFEISAKEFTENQILFCLKVKPDMFKGNVNPKTFLLQNIDDLVNNCSELNNLTLKFFLYEEMISKKEFYTVYRNLLNLCDNTTVHNYSQSSYALHLKESDITEEKCNKAACSREIDKIIENLSSNLYQGNKDEFFAQFGTFQKLVTKNFNFINTSSAKCYFSLSMLYINFIDRYKIEGELSKSSAIQKLYSPIEFLNWKDTCEYLKTIGNQLFELVKKEEQSCEKSLVDEIKLFIRDNFDSELTLTMISNRVNYSNSYVSRIFNELEGMNITAYINQVRIAKAKEMLESTNHSILEISEKIGFDTPQYFSLVFKKNVGISPKEYRLNV